MPSVRQMVVPAQHDQLSRLALFVGKAAIETGFSESQANRIELAVDEACSNIIDHAYHGVKGKIHLKIKVEPHHQITIILVDQGARFDPGRVPEFAPYLSLDDVKIGGLGIHLMRQAMDDVWYEFDVPGIGNRLTMIKRI